MNTNIVDKKEIITTSAYVPYLDMTIIVEDIWENGNMIRTEIKGFYYGKPDKEQIEIFKEKGVVCNYGDNRTI